MQWSCHSQGQIKDNSTFTLRPNQTLVLNLKFAEHILIEAWDRSEVAFTPIISAQPEALKEAIDIQINENEGQLSIVSDLKQAILKPYQNRNWRCDSANGISVESICLRQSYKLKIPRQAILNVETISGDIEIRGLEAAMVEAKSISGFVDVDCPPNARQNLDFRSVTGEIYSDFDIQLNEDSNPYSKRLYYSLNGGGQKFRLETVSGDIFFRKR